MSDVESGAFEHRLAWLIAEDVHWMMQRINVPAIDLASTTPSRFELIADTRYTRMLRGAAEAKLTELEKEVTDGDGH